MAVNSFLNYIRYFDILSQCVSKKMCYEFSRDILPSARLEASVTVSWGMLWCAFNSALILAIFLTLFYLNHAPEGRAIYHAGPQIATYYTEEGPEQDSRVCPICFVSPLNATFLCGHQLCTTCAEIIKRHPERALRKCHLCRGSAAIYVTLRGTY